jgi:hypothetical protein
LFYAGEKPRDEHRLRMFENRALTRIFGTERGSDRRKEKTA